MNQEEKVEGAAEGQQEAKSETDQVVKEGSKEEGAAEQGFKERYYYLAAEYDNAIKRLEREKSSIVKFGNENILRDIVASIDLFELTVNALANDPDPKIKNVVVGLEMVRKQMVDTLGKHGLERIAALDKSFDPNLHEAVAQEKSEKAENTVIKEHQAGYLLNGRLLRAAKVVVSATKN